jgi:hypothetical protein
MPVDRVVFAFAGIMVVASIVLAYFVSPWWLLLTAFVGVNMLQAAAIAFKRLGLPIGEAFK